jgi:hypothetical protein
VEGKPKRDIVRRAFEELPEGSLSRRKTQLAIEIVEGHDSFLSAYPLLTERVVNKEYSYGCMAPENLAIVLSLLQLVGNDSMLAINAGLSFGKVSDSVAPLLAALVGGIQGDDKVFSEWNPYIRTLKGICIPEYSGLNYLDLVEEFCAYVSQ